MVRMRAREQEESGLNSWVVGGEVIAGWSCSGPLGLGGVTLCAEVLAFAA